MKTRIGKIAQLPKPIRDDLNHRLANGKQAPELLKWLNGLPETKDLIATKFDNHPISPQNLTEWRHGGYQEWLHHQEREQRIKRLAEEGADLKHHEGDDDLFENTVRITLAELMADLDELHQLKGEARWERLRILTRELARLQNAFNRSRWAELAWTRWNDRFLGQDDYEPETPNSKPEEPRNAGWQPAVSPTGSRQAVTFAERTETSRPTPIDAEIKPDQTKSTTGEGNNGAPACSRLPAQNNSIAEELNDRICESDVASALRADSDGRVAPSLPTRNTPHATRPDPHADFLRKMAHLKTLKPVALPLDTHPLTLNTKRAK